MLRQFLTFAVVGAVGTAGHYLVLVALVQTHLASIMVATTCGFAVGALINYGLNYRFTFGSGKRHSEALPKFLLVALSGALLNYALMWWLSRETSWHYLLAQIVTTALVLAWNFLLNRAWTFAHRPAQ
jgi:putative flippase GtrA